MRGASEGGTPLTVLGSGFSSSAEAVGALRCRLNGSVLSAAYVSEWALTCNTTSRASGHVGASRGHASVEVSTGGREYTAVGVVWVAPPGSVGERSAVWSERRRVHVPSAAVGVVAVSYTHLTLPTKA